MVSSDGGEDKTTEKREKSKKNSLNSKIKTNELCEVTQIDETDVEELRKVYKKCKEVMKKIESKYGHLLNLEQCGGMKRKMSTTENNDLNVCQCPVNKKIVFDDDGKEVTSEADLGTHICVKKLKRTRSTETLNVNHVQVEYDVLEDISLPCDIDTLVKILNDSKIDIKYRHKVIDKIKMLRQEYSDEIRFNKHSLIEKLKSNPDEVLNFAGTNLKILPGYS